MSLSPTHLEEPGGFEMTQKKVVRLWVTVLAIGYCRSKSIPSELNIQTAESTSQINLFPKFNLTGNITSNPTIVLICPILVKTHETFNCTLRVLGTEDATGTIVIDGQDQKSFSWSKDFSNENISYYARLEEAGGWLITVSMQPWADGEYKPQVTTQLLVRAVCPLPSYTLRTPKYTANRTETLELIIVGTQHSNACAKSLKFYWSIRGAIDVTAVTTKPYLMQTFVAEGQYAVVVEVNNGLDGTLLNYTVSVFPECQVRFPGPLPSVRARTPVLYNLASSSPANCKYHWMLNGEYMNETRIPECELFYEKSGKYNVCVAAENLAGRVFPVCEYQTVTSPIYGLQLVSECCSRKSCDIHFAYLDGAVIGASLMINGVVFAPELDKNDREIIFRAGSQTADTLNVVLTAQSTDEHVEVEGKVRVDSPLEDMKVTLSTNTALIGHPVEVRVVLRGGTSGEIRIMYDAVIQRRRLFAPGQAMDTSPHLFTHTFAQNGAHWICVSVTAAAQQRKSCLLLVVDAALYSVYPLRLTPSSGLRVHTPLKLAIGAGDLAERSPLGMFLTVDWSDGSSPTQLANYELGALVEHIYQEAGCYKIRAELTKGQQQVRLFANLEVTAPLHNLMCYMGTAEVAVGQMVPLYAFWRSAKKVDYELLRDGKLIMHGTKSVPFSSVCTFADKATKTGVNAYALRISDNQTSLNCTPSINVVNVDFILNFIVRTSYIEIPGKFWIQMSHMWGTAPLPEYLKITLNCSEGTLRDYLIYASGWDDGHFHDLRFSLREAGRHQCALSSQYTAKHVVTLGYVRLLRSLFLRIFNCATQAEGFGSIRHLFPAGEAICFELIENEGTVLDGTILLYRKNGISYGLIKKMALQTLKFNWTFVKQGQYRIVLHASNILSNLTVSSPFAVGSPVIGMEIEAPDTQLRPFELSWITLRFRGLGDFVCLCVDPDNGRRFVYPKVNGNGTSCRPCPDSLEVIQRPVDGNLQFPVRYTESGLYNFTVLAWWAETVDAADEGSVVQKALLLPVTPHLIPCQPARLFFSDDRLLDADDPLILYTTDEYTVRVKTNRSGGTCEQRPAYIWHIYRLDEQTGAHLELVMQTNQSAASVVQLFLARRTLSPGLYKIQLLSRETSGGLEELVCSGYLRVLPSPLVIRMLEQPLERVYFGAESAEFCISPRRFSFDPNVLDGRDTGLIQRWAIACFEGDDASQPLRITSAGPRCSFPELANASSGHLCVPSERFLPRRVYTFVAMGETAGQRGTGRLEVIRLPVRVPKLSIRTIQPSLVFEGYFRGALMISNTNDLVLRGDCEDDFGGDFCGGSMSWNLSAIRFDGGDARSTPLQDEKTIEGLRTKDLIVPSRLLGTLAKDVLLDVCFHVSVGDQDVAACRRFALTPPPKIVECTTNASSQVGLYETIWVKCTVLLSEGNGATEFRVDVLQGQSRTTLATAYTSTLLVVPPFSEKAQDVCFRATDRFFAYAEKCFATVQFIAPTSSQIYDKLNSFVNGSDQSVEQTLRTGDPNEIANLIYALAPVQAALSHAGLEEEKAREIRSKIVSMLVSAVVTLPIVDAESLVHVASLVTIITSCARDMPGNSQIDLINYLSTLAQGLGQVNSSTPRDDVLNVAVKFSEMSLNLLEGFNYQFTSPLPAEDHMSPGEMDYDTDIDGPVLPEVGKKDLSRILSLQNAQDKQRSRSKLLTARLQQLYEVTAGTLQPLLASGGKGVATASSFGSLSYVKFSTRHLGNLHLGAGAGGTQQSSIILPDLTDLLSGKENVLVQVATTSTNLFQFANTRETDLTPQSETLGLSIFADGRRLPFEDLERTFKINISRLNGTNPPPFTSGSLNGKDDLFLPPPLIAVDGSIIYQPLIMLAYVIEEAEVSFHLQFKPKHARGVAVTDPCPQYLVFARHIHPPDLTAVDDGYGRSVWAVVPPNTAVCGMDLNEGSEELERNYTFFLSNAQLTEGKREAREISQGQLLTARQLNTFYVGYRQLRTDEKNRYSYSHPPPQPYPYQDQINVTVQIRSFLSSCAHLADGSAAWAKSGCNVSAESTFRSVVCECNHLTTFSSHLSPVPPIFSVQIAHEQYQR